ncbi:hypothetical protein B9479_004292 [Cryptococcus floricola]|uniref:SET domain-containing protein n=1 Tax=Cryptococcus floricola TaxID=2591691 RepID=A0A5D3AWE7_9TREE|nr:hypothetical protein B9479_004292 [Cryptococcus floricola]
MFSSDQDARPWWEEDAEDEETSQATAPVQAVTDRKTRTPSPTAGEGPSSTIKNNDESTSHDAPASKDETASHVEPAWDDQPAFDEQPNIYPIEQHAPSGQSYVLTHYIPYPVFPYEDTVNKSHPVYYPVVVHPPTSSPPFHTAYDQWMYSQWKYAQPRSELQVDATTGLHPSRQRSAPSLHSSSTWYTPSPHLVDDSAFSQGYMPPPPPPQPDPSSYAHNAQPQYGYYTSQDMYAIYGGQHSLARQAAPTYPNEIHHQIAKQRSEPAFHRSSIDVALGRDPASGGYNNPYATTNAQYWNPKRQNNSKADHNRTQKPGSMGHPQSQQWQYPRGSQYPDHTYPQTQVHEAPPLSQPTPSRRRSFLDTRPIASMTSFVSRHISRSPSPSKRPGSLAGSETSRQSEGGGRSRVGAGLKRQLSRLLGDKADHEPSYSKLSSDGLLKPPSTSRPSRSPTPPHTPKKESSTPPAPWSARAESLQVVASDTPGILRLEKKEESEGWGVDSQPAQWDGTWSTAEAEYNTRTPRHVDPRSPKPKSPKIPIPLSISTPSYSLKPPRAKTDEDGWQTVRHSRSATSIKNLGKGKGNKKSRKDLKASKSSETLQNERKKVFETEIGVKDMLPGAGDGKAESAGDDWRRSDADGQASHQARNLEQDLDVSGLNTQYVSEAHQDSTTPRIASPRKSTPALDDLASQSTNIVGDSPADSELQAPQLEDTIGKPDESTATKSENERDEQGMDLLTVTTEARKEEEEDAGAEVLDEDDQDCDPSKSRTEDRIFTTPKRKHPKKKTPKKNKKSQDLKPPPPFEDDDFLIPTPPRSPEHSPTLETLDADTPAKKTQGQKKKEKERLKKLQKTWDEEIMKEKEGFYGDSRNRALAAYTYDHTNDSCWWYTDSKDLPPSQPPAYYARRYIPRGTIFMWERPFMCVYNDPLMNEAATLFTAGLQPGEGRSKYDKLVSRYPKAGEDGKLWSNSMILTNDPKSNCHWWGLYERLALMRRSCQPSSMYIWDEKRTVGYLIARHDIPRNTEITLPWTAGMEFQDHAARKATLRSLYSIDSCGCHRCTLSLTARRYSDGARARLQNFFNDQSLPISTIQSPVPYYNAINRCLDDSLSECSVVSMALALETGFWLCCHWSDAESAKVWAGYVREVDLWQWGERHSQWKKWSEYVRCIEQEDWDGLRGQWGRHGDMTVGEPLSTPLDVVFGRSTFKHFEVIHAQRRENALDGPPLPNIVTPSKEDWATAREKRFMDMERFYDFNKVSAGQLEEPDMAGDEETLGEGEEEGTVGK